MSLLKSFQIPFYLTVVLLCVLNTIVSAQDNAGPSSGGMECSQPKNISLPFIRDTGAVKFSKPHLIHQSNPYEQMDQFTYWYKLNVEADMVINCQITPINKNDKYVIYIYKYRGDDFCEKMLKDKIKPVRVENEENKKSIIEASAFSDFEFDAFKYDRFYFSILTISQNNCGHNLRLITGTDTLIIKASHEPCSTSLEKVKKIETTPKVEIKQTADSVVVYKAQKKYDTVAVAVKEINKASRIINPKIKVSDATSGKSMKVIYAKSGAIKIVFEKGKKYTVECIATGYRDFSHPMVISEYITPDSNQLVVYMKPLKTGDNFVMDNIYFFPNTYALKDGSKEALNNLLNYLVNNPEVKIELQGHTNGNNKCKKNKAFKDEGPEWNFSGTAQKLSLLRAEEIKKYLVENGANKDNITTVGFGGEKMIVANPKSPEAIKKNARVEVVIVEAGGL
jgi:outer membrane protein OmpA-like peptidoglycan-associated protein